MARNEIEITLSKNYNKIVLSFLFIEILSFKDRRFFNAKNEKSTNGESLT